MRLDKYLKVSRIIKRRVIAKEAVERGNVLVNGKTAKASTDIKVYDQIEVTYKGEVGLYKVCLILENATEEKAKEMYERIR